MTTQSQHSSAKIYQFPRKIAAGAEERRRADKAADLATRHNPDIEFGSAWYHQAAVQDAERPRKP